LDTFLEESRQKMIKLIKRWLFQTSYKTLLQDIIKLPVVKF
jgi:hypothetical protein